MLAPLGLQSGLTHGGALDISMGGIPQREPEPMSTNSCPGQQANAWVGRGPGRTRVERTLGAQYDRHLPLARERREQIRRERSYKKATKPVRAFVSICLIVLAVTACTTSDTRKSDAEAERAKLAPLQPPPFLATGPELTTQQAASASADVAEVAPTLSPPTLDAQPAVPASQGASPAQTVVAPAPSAEPLARGEVVAGRSAAAVEPGPDEVPADTGWPRTLSANGQTFEVYQPQLDAWDGLTLEAYAAVAVESGGEQPPLFGVVSLSARTLVDKDERLVGLEDLKVSDAHFPAAPEQGQAYVQLLKDVLPREIKSIALDRLEAQLAIQRARGKVEAISLDNRPPQIVFMQQPALLVCIDGEPKYVQVEGTNLTRVLNTRVLLLQAPTGKLYLHLLDGYMEAATMSGPWTVAKTPPADAAKAETAARDLHQVDLLEALEDPDPKKKPSLASDSAPQIIVATVPTELIVTQGKPIYAPLGGTSLLYVKNTTADVFRLLTDQMTYVLLGGRWFRAKSIDGPWMFVAAKSLPREFTKIPDASPKENVKAGVPGTRQAQEALIANRIPTSARFDPRTVSFAVQTDGDPKLATISGTSLQYVLNASAPVIRVDDKTWYACQGGVWFVASALSGPWAMASSVPAVLYTIPPSSPIYYVTFVRVYRTTPTHVYVGYTSGYYGAVVAPGGVVVYGTGYAYPPWVGRYWHGSPVTYGVGASMVWTPWTGWAFGFGFGWPHDTAWYHPPAPWWGPYYASGYNAQSGVAAWGPGGWASTAGSIYAERAAATAGQRGAATHNPFGGNQWVSRYGTAYNSTNGTLIVGQKGAMRNLFSGYGSRAIVRNVNIGVTAVPAPRPRDSSRTIVAIGNDHASEIAGPVDQQVFGTKDGNVYRRGDKGQWEQVTRPSSVAKSPITPPQAAGVAQTSSQYPNAGAQRLAQPPSAAAPRPLAGNMQDLDRQRRAQDVGNLRANSFQNSRPPGGFHGSAAGAGASRRSKVL